MGTRSLTYVHNGDHPAPFVSMYGQMDGYPSGHGKELATFLKPIRIVNGIGATDQPIANGAGCLAAQLVAHFKDGPGQFYLVAPSSKNHGQEYEYHVFADDEIGIIVRVYETSGLKFIRKKLLYETNDMSAFERWCGEN